MSAADKELVKAAGSIPAPQFYNPKTDRYEVITGRDGANAFIEKGRVTKDIFKGTSSVTKTYTTNMFGFAIVNQGDAELTFTINGIDVPVDPYEAFDELFEPFTTVTVTTTGKFKAVVRE